MRRAVPWALKVSAPQLKLLIVAVNAKARLSDGWNRTMGSLVFVLRLREPQSQRRCDGHS